MAVYQRILLAVDLAPNSVLVGQRARELADAFEAELHLVHVVEPIPAMATIPLDPVGPAAVTNHAQMLELAQELMGKLAGELGVPEAHWNLVVGTTRSEIVRAAAEGGMDLIVIGNRERHGLAFLFKPTEESVVQHAPCDVLAVRLTDDEGSASAL
jgi:universal stress protein A